MALIAADGSSAVVAEPDVHVSGGSSQAIPPETMVSSDVDGGAADTPELISSSNPSAELPPTIVTSMEPELVPAPAAEIRSAPKARARAAEPVDRTTLIRQRWAETGIRMWNPRLHGTGHATLNIQGCVELLPPAPGETLPRYDKLEFKLLGGQIVCEGVILDAPAQADKRSFTRLAEPRNPDRPREPVWERQAALA